MQFLSSIEATHKANKKQNNEISIRLKQAIRDHQKMDLKQSNELFFEAFIRETAIYDKQANYKS